MMRTMNYVSSANQRQIDQIVRYLLDEGNFPEKARIMHLGAINRSILSKLAELRPDLDLRGIAEDEKDILEARRRFPYGQFTAANLAEKMPFKEPF